MPGNGLTDLLLALLHAVAAPRHHRHGHRGGRHHRYQILAPAPPLQPLSLAMSPLRVLERPPSPSPDRLAYRPMEPLDPNDSPWSHRVVPCAVYGWACPNWVAPAQGASSSGNEWGEEGREEETDEC
jgi:hypothetical protein